MSPALALVVPGDPEQRTGGYLYDRRMAEELRAVGWTVQVFGLDGSFPQADALARQSMDAALASLPDGSTVLVDGLALGGVPDAVAAHARRLEINALVHHPLADETGLEPDTRLALLASERAALALCRKIIVTSRFTARRLRELGLGASDAIVVEPGVEPAPLAPVAQARLADGTEPAQQRLLCVASLAPRKGQDLLVDALSRLGREDWVCRLAGSDQRNPDYAAALRRQIQRLDLADRIELPGERNEAELQADYAWASVCVLPSHYEGYGMVVTEALARGLPMLCGSGGALVDTLPESAGIRVSSNDATAWAQALQRWLDDGELRLALSRGAAALRPTLPRWTDSARRLALALGSAR